MAMCIITDSKRLSRVRRNYDNGGSLRALGTKWANVFYRYEYRERVNGTRAAGAARTDMMINSFHSKEGNLLC